MRTFEDAQALVEAMTENPFKEGLVIKQLGPDDGQNVGTSPLIHVGSRGINHSYSHTSH